MTSSQPTNISSPVQFYKKKYTLSGKIVKGWLVFLKFMAYHNDIGRMKQGGFLRMRKREIPAFYRQLLVLVLPIAIQNLISAMVNSVDVRCL